MVERIADLDSLYDRRLHLRRNYEGYLLEVDSSQVSAVRVLGHRVRRNTFKASSGWYNRRGKRWASTSVGTTILK